MATEWAGFSYMAHDDLSSLDWPTLETVAGVTFSDTHRRHMLKTLNTYISVTSLLQQGPRIHTLRSYFKKLKTRAQALSVLLGSGSATKQEAVSRMFPSDPTQPQLLMGLLREFNLRAAIEEQKLPKAKTGRHENVDLRLLIRAWFDVYREAGGTRVGRCYVDRVTRKYRGPFLDLIETAFQQVRIHLCDTTELRRPQRRRWPYLQFTRESLGQTISKSIPRSRQQAR